MGIFENIMSDFNVELSKLLSTNLSKAVFCQSGQVRQSPEIIRLPMASEANDLANECGRFFFQSHDVFRPISVPTSLTKFAVTLSTYSH
jgi:hypothetical protein